MNLDLKLDPKAFLNDVSNKAAQGAAHRLAIFLENGEQFRLLHSKDEDFSTRMRGVIQQLLKKIQKWVGKRELTCKGFHSQNLCSL